MAPLQRKLRLTRCSGPLRCIFLEQDHRPQQCVQMLFRPERLVLDLLPIMGSGAPGTLLSKT